MNKFTLGIAAGMTSLVVAVPLVVQMAGAATESGDVLFSAADEVHMMEGKTPTQECVLAMANLESAHLANFDSTSAQRKTEMQTRINGLQAAAAIEDEDARAEALKTMHQGMEKPEFPQAIQDAMDAIQESCEGGKFFFGGPHGGFGMAVAAPGMFNMKVMHAERGVHLAEKLGMTEEELKAALEDGKTIEELADEKGIELPVKIKRFMRFEEEAIEQ